MNHEDTVLRMALTAWLTDPRHGPSETERALLVARLTVTTHVGIEGVPRGTDGNGNYVKDGARGTVPDGHAPSFDWRIPRQTVRISTPDRQELRRMALGWAASMPRVADELRRQWDMDMKQAELFD